MTAGVLFDLDGTLVDSNYLHTLAWSRALDDVGEWAPMHVIHRAIGMGGDQILPHLIGRTDPEIEHFRSAHYAPLMAEVRAFPSASALVRQCRDAGLLTVLATSSPPDEVGVSLRTLGPEPLFDVIVTADDVSTSKPSPEVLEIAIDRSGIERGRCVLVGDSRWDVEAASRAGIGCIGLECGGTSSHELDAQGALAIAVDPADLLATWRASPLATLSA